MRHNPFGPTIVSIGGRYLGAWLAAASRVALGNARRWEDSQLDLMREELWRRTVEKPAGGTAQLL
eukprot:3204360-Lingulodinium_polyedra.AAC.1